METQGLGAGAFSSMSSAMRLNPNPPAAHVQGTLPATNAWTVRQSVFASEPNPMTPGIAVPAQTRLYVPNTNTAHGFVNAYWPGRGWNFVPFADIMMESDYVRMNTPTQGFRPSATIRLDGIPGEMEMQNQNITGALAIIGLGRGRSLIREGFGAIGPFGNADAGQVLSASTEYQITGSGVALRNPLVDGLGESGVLRRLNIGDSVSVGESVRGGGAADSQGEFINFAWVTAGNQQGYVAVEYLGPSGSVSPSQVSNVSQVTTTDITHDSSSTFESVKSFINRNSTPILIGAGLLGVGIIGMALLAKPGRKRRKGGAKRHSTRRLAYNRR